VTAVLSTTAKSRAREARKEARKLGRHSSRDGSIGGPGTPTAGAIPEGGVSLERVTSHLSTTSYLSVEEKHSEAVVDEPKKKEREPSSFTLSNPDRLVPTQVPYITVLESQRYVPVDHRMVHPTGIVMLMDSDPIAPEDVLKVERIALGQEGEEDAEPPEPFRWRPGDEED